MEKEEKEPSLRQGKQERSPTKGGKKGERFRGFFRGGREEEKGEWRKKKPVADLPRSGNRGVNRIEATIYLQRKLQEWG